MATERWKAAQRRRRLKWRLRQSVTFSIADEHAGEWEQQSVLRLPDMVGMGGSEHFREK